VFFQQTSNLTCDIAFPDALNPTLNLSNVNLNFLQTLTSSVMFVSNNPPMNGPNFSHSAFVSNFLVKQLALAVQVSTSAAAVVSVDETLTLAKSSADTPQKWKTTMCSHFLINFLASKSTVIVYSPHGCKKTVQLVVHGAVLQVQNELALTFCTTKLERTAEVFFSSVFVLY